MCGVAGIWERTGRPVERAALERMGAILAHRGPDGSAIFHDGALGLVNRRLAIVDPSHAGDQPIGLHARELWLSFNGEIHNYLELRRELEAEGAHFQSHSDSEVVLYAYDRWGTDCFERFNGMWGLAIWDGQARELVLARDRFGIKPLCYSVREGRIAFASEPKAILTAFPEERQLDEAELGRYLRGYRSDGGEETFFSGIRQVRPATCLVVSEDAIRQLETWSFEPGREEPRADAEERFRELLADSIRLRMRSDVTVGISLSGGLDSGAVAALVEPPADRPMPAFALRYPGWSSDESHYSALSAASRPGRFELNWIQPEPTRVLETIRKIVWHHDAPMPVRGRLGEWFVMEAIGRQVKVALDGHGGDELLAGYAYFVMPHLVDRLLGRPGTTGRRGLLGDALDLGQLESRSRLWFLGRAAIPPVQRALGLPPQVFAIPRSLPHHPRERGEQPYRSALNNALWSELRSGGLPESLHGVDALSMAFSVESRAPFLDHRLVEFCFSLPASDKIAGGWTKSLLRRSLAGVVPDEILARRRKLGFSAPVGKWLLEPTSWDDVRGLLLDPVALERGLFRRGYVERELGRFVRAPALYRAHTVGRLWRWIVTELWFRDFLDTVPS